MARNSALGGERIVSEVKKCPKCGGEMVQGEFLKNIPKIVVSPKKSNRRFDKVIPTYCEKCGFMEIHKEMKERKD
jgi:ribosomal protein S27AE